MLARVIAARKGRAAGDASLARAEAHASQGPNNQKPQTAREIAHQLKQFVSVVREIVTPKPVAPGSPDGTQAGEPDQAAKLQALQGVFARITRSSKEAQGKGGEQLSTERAGDAIRLLETIDRVLDGVSEGSGSLDEQMLAAALVADPETLVAAQALIAAAQAHGLIKIDLVMPEAAAEGRAIDSDPDLSAVVPAHASPASQSSAASTLPSQVRNTASPVVPDAAPIIAAEPPAGAVSAVGEAEDVAVMDGATLERLTMEIASTVTPKIVGVEDTIRAEVEQRVAAFAGGAAITDNAELVDVQSSASVVVATDTDAPALSDAASRLTRTATVAAGDVHVGPATATIAADIDPGTLVVDVAGAVDLSEAVAGPQLREAIQANIEGTTADVSTGGEAATQPGRINGAVPGNVSGNEPLPSVFFQQLLAEDAVQQAQVDGRTPVLDTAAPEVAVPTSGGAPSLQTTPESAGDPIAHVSETLPAVEVGSRPAPIAPAGITAMAAVIADDAVNVAPSAPENTSNTALAASEADSITSETINLETVASDTPRGAVQAQDGAGVDPATSPTERREPSAEARLTSTEPAFGGEPVNTSPSAVGTSASLPSASGETTVPLSASGGTQAVGAAEQANASPASPMDGNGSPVDLQDQIVPVLIRQARLVRVGEAHEMALRLEPERLGPLHIRITLAAGALRIGFDSSSADAQRSLEMALPQLRSALLDAGLRLDRLDVGLRDSGSGNGSSDQNLSDSNSGRQRRDPSGGGTFGRQSGDDQNGIPFSELLVDQDGRPFRLGRGLQQASSAEPTSIGAAELRPAPGTLARSRGGYGAYGALRTSNNGSSQTE